MKKTLRIICLLMGIILLPGLIYLGLAIYYQDSFYVGTWINGIYCTGKTPAQVQKELTENYSYSGLLIQGRGKNGQIIEALLEPAEIDLTYHFEPALKEYLERQNPFRWFYQVISGNKPITLNPEITFDEKKAEEWLIVSAFVKDRESLPKDQLSIVLMEAGYQLQEKKEEILDSQAALTKIKEALYTGETQLNLLETNSYFYRKETLEMEKLRELFEQVEQFQSRTFIYEIKDIQRAVTKQEMALLIKRDEKGDFLLDEEGRLMTDEGAVDAFVRDLVDTYSNWQNHHFVTHDGREVKISRGNYGIRLSVEAEKRYLLEYLSRDEDLGTVRIPRYQKDVTYKNSHGIGNTYIEIDLTQQKMFFFEEGQLQLETDVVTGCKSRGMSTPEMVCYIYNKDEDAVLRGEDYRAPVNYWVPVYQGIGIHDATWRSRFGGEIYVRDGSHGCINTPLEKMEELYNMTEIGMPVIIHK